MKLGVMFGNPETTTGGNALKFYASLRLDIRRVESLKQDQEVIGNHVKVTVVKNKVAPPFRKAEFDILFAKGIARMGELVDLAVARHLSTKSGAWYAYHGKHIAQGRDAAIAYFDANPAAALALTNTLKAESTPDALSDFQANPSKPQASAPSEPETLPLAQEATDTHS